MRKSSLVAIRGFFFFENHSQSRTIETKTDSFRWIQVINPIRWITWPTSFLLSFILSRPYLSLGPALFALLTLLAVIGLFAQWQYQGGKSSRVQLYQGFYSEAIGTKNFKRALIASKVLISLQPNDLRFQFERALIEKELGNEKLAEELMLRLASQKKYGLAALWLAEQKFDMSKIDSWKEEEHQFFRALMASAIASSKGDTLYGAKFKLASYLSHVGANAESLGYLEEIVSENPQLAITACELALSVNDKIRLQTLLPIAINYHRNELRKSPENIDHRLALARAYVIDESIDEAIQLLEDGERLQTDQKYKNAIAEAYIHKCNEIGKGKQSADDLIQRIRIVHQALIISPKNPLVVDTLLDLLIQCRDNQNDELNVLKEATIQGLDPESLHFLRGTIALMENKNDEAKTHLDLASKSGLALPGVLNNLAVAIASQKGGDLNQALALANSALERFPHPYTYETRGQILFKMEKYQDCILDLEKGLQAPELGKMIYPSLISAYQKIGNSKLADEYAERFKEINANQTSTYPKPSNNGS